MSTARAAADINTVFDSLHNEDTVFVGSACGEPQTLVDLLLENRERWSGLRIMTGLQSNAALYTDGPYRSHFRLMTVMSNRNAAKAIAAGHADYIPSSIHQTARNIRSGRQHLDVAMVQVSPPDLNGMCSLGVNVGYNRAAIEVARTVVAEINEQMPRTRGATLVHRSAFDVTVPSDRPLLEVPPANPSSDDMAIGRAVAEQIDDGDTLHVGVGSVGYAILAALHARSELRMHTGSASDAVLDLANAGALRYSDHEGRGPVVTGQLIGTNAFYRFAHDNPLFWIDEPSYTHAPAVLGAIDRFISVNSAVEVDLRGQVNAETLVGNQIAGIGGAIDYAMGASISREGVSIVALPSTTSNGISRIVPKLPDGVVTLPCSLVDMIITEQGTADLRGLGLADRAEALIAVASPAARAHLAGEVANLPKRGASDAHSRSSSPS